MTAVFLDTVGLIAMWNRSDQWHADAMTAFADMVRRQVRLTRHHTSFSSVQMKQRDAHIAPMSSL